MPKWTPPLPQSFIDWDGILKIPISEYESGHLDISNLEGWIDVATQFKIEVDDGHMINKECTSAVMRLMRLLLSKADYDANLSYTENTNLHQQLAALKEKTSLINRSTKKAVDAKVVAEDSLKEMETRFESLNKEKKRIEESYRQLQNEVKSQSAEASSRQEELVKLKKELRRANRQIEELRMGSSTQQSDYLKTEVNNTLLLTEHKHLMTKYRDTADRLSMLQEEHDEAKIAANNAKVVYENEISNLRDHISSLQQDNAEALRSRDKAESLLERRESEALNDLQEMQLLQKEQLDAEKQRYHSLRDQYMQIKSEFEILKRKDHSHARVEELRAKDEKIAALENELQGVGAGFRLTTGVGHSVESGVDSSTLQKIIKEKEKLEDENKQLDSEVDALEMRLESQEAECLRLAKTIKDYERGDEGFKAVRAELDDANRMVSMVNDENLQLRERLANAENNIVLCEALKEICLRVGVKQEELDVLYSKEFMNTNEMEVLRQEVRSLKEEVEWVEKERKHWMRKVRLQPLLDTKLRFELGLTQEQLSQLDDIVDQMKSGGVIVDDGDYREKYYEEVRARQREVQSFNEAVKARIESALEKFLEGRGSPVDGGYNTSVLSLEELEMLRDRVSRAAESAEQNADVSMQAMESSAQASALQRRLHQQELIRRDDATLLSDLRCQISRLEAEKSMLVEERDIFRQVVLEHLGGDDVEGFVDGIVSGTRKISDDTSDVVNQSADGLNDDSKVVSLIKAVRQKRSKPMTSGGPSAETSRLIEVLQNQIKVKDELALGWEKEYLEEKQSLKIKSSELEHAIKELDKEKTRVTLLIEQVETATTAADMAEMKVQELERIKSDLESVCNRQFPVQTNELLQKIVVLRQREGRLVQRIRSAMQEQERLTARDKEQENYITQTLNVIKNYLRSSNVQDQQSAAMYIDSQHIGGTLNKVLPSGYGQAMMEQEILQDLQMQMVKLSKGQLFQDDIRFVAETKRLYIDLARAQTDADSGVSVSQLRRDLSDSQLRVSELELIHGTGAGSTTNQEDLNTKRLQSKEVEIRLLEEALNDAEEEVKKLRAQLEENCISKPGLFNGNIDSEATDGVNLPTGVAEITPKGYSQFRHTAEMTKRLERELARYKSMNLGLIQSAIDEQVRRKALQCEIDAKDKEILLLKEGGESHTVSSFVSAALRDNCHLQKESEMAQHMAKKLKLQLVVAEANFRVVSNEAASYKISAYRLYRTYVEHVTKIIEVVRQVQRSCEGAMTVREVAMLHKRLMESFRRVDVVEVSITKAIMEKKIAEQTVQLLQDEQSVLRAKDPLKVQALLQQLSTDTRSKLRAADRRIAELSEDQEHYIKKQERTEHYMSDLEREISRLETGAIFFSINDEFVDKLKGLYDTVYAKSESPPVAISFAQGCSNSSLSPFIPSGNASDDQMVRNYRDALDQQASLTQQCTRLQNDLKETQKQLMISEANREAMKEELSYGESRIQAANSSLESERMKCKQREDRLSLAHKTQMEVMQRAVDHNTNCLKEIIKSKEHGLERAEQQLATERERFLEHQLMDTARMERLHEQLFRENTAMVEKFKSTLSGPEGGAYTPVMPQQVNNIVGDPANPAIQASLQSQVKSLTSEVLTLRKVNHDLKSENISLHTTLSDQINAHQRKVREAMLEEQQRQHKALGTTPLLDALRDAATTSFSSPRPIPRNTGDIESTLYALTEEQSVALDSLRKREASLRECLLQEQSENLRLKGLLDGKLQLEMSNVNSTVLSPETIRRISMPSSHESVADLRAYISTLEEQLRKSQAESSNLKMMEQQTATIWRQQLEDMKAKVSSQSAEVDRAKDLIDANEALRTNVNEFKDQHDKMVAAVALLKMQLTKKQVEGDSKERQLQQDMALAQRLGVLQEGTGASIKQFQKRMDSLQKELHSKVAREEDLLRKAKEAQHTALGQHEELLRKDILIHQLQSQNERMKVQLERGSCLYSGAKSNTVEQASQTAAVLCSEIAIRVTSEGAKSSDGGHLEGISTTPAVINLEDRSAEVAALESVVANLRQQLADALRTSLLAPSEGVDTDQKEAMPMDTDDQQQDLLKVNGAVKKDILSVKYQHEKMVHALAQLKQLLIKKSSEQTISSMRTTTSSLYSRQAQGPQQYQSPEEITKKLVDLQDITGQTIGYLELRMESVQKAIQCRLRREKEARNTLRKQKEELLSKEGVISSLRAEVKQLKHELQELKAEGRQKAQKIPIRTDRSTTPPSGGRDTTEKGSPVDKTKPSSPQKSPREAVILEEQLKWERNENSRLKKLIADATSLGGGIISSSAMIASTSRKQVLTSASRKADTVNRRSVTAVTEERATIGQESKSSKQSIYSDPTYDGHAAAHKSVSFDGTSVNTVAQSQPFGVQFLPTSIDIRNHKKEIMRLEELVDKLRREVSVTKESEIRNHILDKDRQILRIRELEAALISPSTRNKFLINEVSDNVCTISEQQAIDNISSLTEQLNEKMTVITDLENKVLHQEGMLLDLRFERELLAIKSQRIQTHMEEILAVDAANACLAKTTSRLSPSSRTLSPTDVNIKRTSHAQCRKDISTLEGVIEGLRGAIERVQAENRQLKNNAIPSSKYVDSVREIKSLKEREKELVKHLEILDAKYQDAMHSTKGYDQYASLQRKLRMAQNAAEQYQLELHGLKQRVGIPISPRIPHDQIIGSASLATFYDPIKQPPAHLHHLGESGRTNVVEEKPPLNLSPYAPEHHILDLHHRGKV